MPTFVYVKNERKVHEVKGANAAQCVFPRLRDYSRPRQKSTETVQTGRIEAGIKQFVGAGGGAQSGNAFPGQGHSLGGTPVPTEAPPAEANYFKYLLFAVAIGLWIWNVRSKGQ